MRVATKRSRGRVPGRWLGTALVLVLAPLACGGGSTGPTDPDPDPGPGPGPGPDTTVATVTLTAPSTTLEVGSGVQLTAVAKNAAGQTLTGKSFAWSSSDEARATVSASGHVSALAPGAVTITATESSSGKSGSVELSVVPVRDPGTDPSAERVVITPRFAVVDVGSATSFDASAFDSQGAAIAAPQVAWAAAPAAVVTVDQAGTTSGVAPGLGTLTAQVDAAVDTAWIAVLGASDLLSTAFVDGEPLTEARPGQTVQVAVQLDLARISPDGDLGAVQFDLRFDDAVLDFQSAESGLSGSVSHNVPEPGLFKFGFAATSAQGAPELTLVTITFQVAADAAAGTRSTLSLEHTAAPTGTDFQTYAMPIVAAGRLLVVAP